MPRALRRQRIRRCAYPAIPGLSACLFALVLAFLTARPVAAQSGIAVPQNGLDRAQPNSRIPVQPPLDTPGGPDFRARSIRTLNQMRHKAMVDDTEKLLLLARELNDDAANLSPTDRFRKTAEIEKLAKSVRDKMSYTVNDNTVPMTYSLTSP